jgi:hypothetical protein
VAGVSHNVNGLASVVSDLHVTSGLWHVRCLTRYLDGKFVASAPNLTRIWVDMKAGKRFSMQ